MFICRDYSEIEKIEYIEEEETERIVYNGPLILDEVLEFHQKHNKKPVSWQSLLERIDDGENKLKCTICEEKFSKQNRFKIHAMKHTGEKPFKCRMPDCTISYQSRNGLKLHLMGHIGGPKYKCDVCGETFGNQGSTYRHMKKFHTAVSTFSIVGQEKTVFDQVDPYLDDLMEYHRNIIPESEASEAYTEIVEDTYDKYKCIECGVRSSTVRVHLAHVIMHTGELAFKCKVQHCSDGFNSYEALKEHLKADHYKGKKYICEVCGKKFETKKLLERHSDDDHVDKKEEPTFACKYCDGLFPRKANALRHEKLHNPGNERLLKCELCDKKFLNGNMRKTHKMREHGVEVRPWKPKKDDFFTCVKCFSSFIDRGSFEEHKEACTFVVNENFQCRFCLQKFQEQLEYQEHEQTFHDDQWKQLIIDDMENIYEDMELEDDENWKPPTALEMANIILEDATPNWKKS